MDVLRLVVLAPIALCSSSQSCQFNMVYCMDESKSISDLVYELEQGFIEDHWQQVSTETGSSILTSYISFSTENSVRTFFITRSEYDKLTIDRIYNSSTYIGKCLHKARTMEKPNDFKNVVLVVTDGVSNTFDLPSAKTESDAMRSEGYFIQAAGFGNYQESRLLEIAGNKENIIYGDKVEDITNKISILVDEICIRNFKCEIPPLIPHGNQDDLNKCYDKKPGDCCSVRCDEGYVGNGDTSICIEDVGWSETFTCSKNNYDCPLHPEVVEATEASLKECENKDISYQCHILCNSGYEKIGEDPICEGGDSNGGWGTLPECKFVYCENPPIVNNSLQPSNNSCANRFLGDKCEVKCNEGFVIIGGLSICTENGWDPVPTCTQHCPYLQQIEFANISTTVNCNNTKLGDECNISCINGYDLFRKIPECSFEAEWLDVPLCLKKEKIGTLLVIPAIAIVSLIAIASLFSILNAFPPPSVDDFAISANDEFDPIIDDPEIKIFS